MRIKPYQKNKRYWQYKGEPVLLLGGSREDNLFQIDDLKEHLDLLHSVGGNYIRNVMSSRDEGDVWPFAFENGIYNLDKWNEEYWRRFIELLSLTEERDIIVQIEIWDRFDYSRDEWIGNPWNPSNNMNYSYDDTLLESEYPLHPYLDLQPFFHSIPGMKEYKEEYRTIREYQERYIDMLLSISLRYPNVLYTMNNETTTSDLWGKYWIGYIKEKAKAVGAEVYCNDMFDTFWEPENSKEFDMVLNDADTYDFIEISQINSRNFARKHWERLEYILDRTKAGNRPLNNTKVYGGGNSSFGSGTSQDGVERFLRNIIAGTASARFHRPTSGNGLNVKAQAVIKSVRMVEEYLYFWDIEPRMDLITQWHDNGAYIAAIPGEKYLIYFTNGRTLRLDLKDAKGRFKMMWIDISKAEISKQDEINGGDIVNIAVPGEGNWFAVIIKEQ